MPVGVYQGDCGPLIHQSERAYYRSHIIEENKAESDRESFPSGKNIYLIFKSVHSGVTCNG